MHAALVLLVISAEILNADANAVADWRDRYGRSCASYSRNTAYCLSADFYANEAGQSARTMCCACGGAPAGFGCRGTETILCPAGYKCLGSSFQQQDCDAGAWCPEGTIEPKPCVAPAGRYCPPRTATEAGSLCPMGSYCLGGAHAPLQCQVESGFYCPEGSTQAMPGVSCPAGHWCPGRCPLTPTSSTGLHTTTTASATTTSIGTTAILNETTALWATTTASFSTTAWLETTPAPTTSLGSVFHPEQIFDGPRAC